MCPVHGGGDHAGVDHPPHLHRPLLPGPGHSPGGGEVPPLYDVEVLDLWHGELCGPALLDVLGQTLAPVHGDQVLGLDVADWEQRLDLHMEDTHQSQPSSSSYLLRVVVVVMLQLRVDPNIRLEVGGLQHLLGLVLDGLLPREGDTVRVTPVHHQTLDKDNDHSGLIIL